LKKNKKKISYSARYEDVKTIANKTIPFAVNYIYGRVPSSFVIKYIVLVTNSLITIYKDHYLDV